MNKFETYTEELHSRPTYWASAGICVTYMAASELTEKADLEIAYLKAKISCLEQELLYVKPRNSKHE